MILLPYKFYIEIVVIMQLHSSDAILFVISGGNLLYEYKL